MDQEVKLQLWKFSTAGKVGGKEMRMEMTAEEAYAEAERLIAEVREGGGNTLDLSNLPSLTELPSLQGLEELRFLVLGGTKIHDISQLQHVPKLELLDLGSTRIDDLSFLEDLPNLTDLSLDGTGVVDLSPLRWLRRLEVIFLGNTLVSDITPLEELRRLRAVSLWNTPVADITALQSHTDLEHINLTNTLVTDLRPIANIPFRFTEDGLQRGLLFADTPIAEASETLRALSQISDDRERTDKTLEYLRSLPPAPAPLPWEVPKPSSATTITVPQLLEAQDSAGWRFSPEHGTMSLYIRNEPLEARQEQLAKLALERVQLLLQKNGMRNASGGLRQEVAEEATRFSDILQDNTRSLSSRSLDLWGSLLALGGQLEANDAGQRAQRDPLDLLTGEARTSLQTFLGIAGNLVRSFPEARALDDGNADFTRRAVTTDMVLALLEEAMRSQFVDSKSGALIQHVADVSRKTGTQADKAFSSTATGGRNLAYAAILAAPFIYTADGVASGILNDIGADISNQQQLGERANAFIENARNQIEAMLENSPPDEAARMRSALDDLTKKTGPR